MILIPIISVPVYLGVSFSEQSPPGVTKLGGRVVCLEVPISGTSGLILNLCFVMYLEWGRGLEPLLVTWKETVLTANTNHTSIFKSNLIHHDLIRVIR